MREGRSRRSTKAGGRLRGEGQDQPLAEPPGHLAAAHREPGSIPPAPSAGCSLPRVLGLFQMLEVQNTWISRASERKPGQFGLLALQAVLILHGATSN